MGVMMRLALRKSSRRNSVALDAAESEFVATTFNTELGWLALAERDDVLAGLVFGRATERQAADALCRSLRREDGAIFPVDFLAKEEQPESIRDIITRLERFAAGAAVDFRDVAIDDRHLTRFGRRVVDACRRIPRGETRSYGQLAAACGSPGAARAVGQVMAKNRYPLIVPCHRVLAAGGHLGGFSAPQGLSMKRRLLVLESSTPSACRTT
jgi:methylated-DNA-[protein]-cysteine S-methyltransferase